MGRLAGEVMADDSEQIDRIRSKLYDFVANNPGHADADQARRILGKLPKVEVAGPKAGPGFDEKEMETGAGGPLYTDRFAGHGQNPVRDTPPLDANEHGIDPTTQELIKNGMLGAAGHFAGGLLGNAIANTRGAHAAEVLAEANGHFDPAAEKAAEALRFKLLPDKEHMAMSLLTGGAGGYFHHPGLGLLADFAARNAVPMEGAIARGAAGRLLPPALQVGGNVGAEALK